MTNWALEAELARIRAETARKEMRALEGLLIGYCAAIAVAVIVLVVMAIAIMFAGPPPTL